MKTRFFGCLLAGLMFCNAAPAQQILSYLAQVPSSATDWATTLQLAGFDSNLGTLTQVRLIYKGDVNQSVFAENLDGPNQTYDLRTTATLSLVKTGGPTLIASGPIILQKIGTLGVFDGAVDFAGLSGVTFSRITTYCGVYIDPNLAAYVNVGTVNFNAAALASSVLTMGGGNAADGAATMADARLTVEYTYSPIPEPATYAAFLGLAALGAALLRGRVGRGPRPTVSSGNLIL